MRTGILNRQIAIVTLKETTTGGDVTQVDSLVQVVRASVKQVTGTRFFKVGELVDRIVYEITLWDLNFSHNIKILYGNLTLYPIAPVLRNPDRSFRSVVKIFAATKAGDFTSLISDDMKYLMTVNLAAGVDTVITTPLTTEPYNVEFIAADGTIITTGLGTPSLALIGGVYVLTVFSTEALNAVKVKFIY